MKISLLTLLLAAASLMAQEAVPPPTALDALSAFKASTGRVKLTGLVEMRGTGGTPTPELWSLVLFDPASPTKLGEFRIRGSRIEDRGPCRTYYPAREPSGYFDFSKVQVDCAGAFRIADKEAGRAMVGFDVIDYVLRCREFSDEPVWILTLRTAAGVATGTVSISAAGGKVLRTVWHRTAAGVRTVPEDSAIPAEYRPAPPAPLPDPFPGGLEPAAPAPPAPVVEPEGKLPPPPPLPPLGAPGPGPNVIPD